MNKEVCDELISEVRATYKEKNELSNSLLSALQFVFQAPLLPALDLLDKNRVTKFISPNGRCVYQVLGSCGTPYICLSTVNYCSCAAFRFSVLKKKAHILCKHLLAIRLGEAMERVKEETLTDIAITDMIQQMD